MTRRPAGGFSIVTPAQAGAGLPADGEQYAVVLSHGSLELGWYAPRIVDDQEPHERDELYVVAAGSARMVVDGAAERAVERGDAIFVASGRAHRFSAMSDDFATWVAFYGPAGGEEP
jgi:mannose-6-phosphate isomerase-like protein (cupin superfamily)